MKSGAFALIDCLGFKGIWRRLPNGDTSPLISKLQEIQTLVDDLVKSKKEPFDLDNMNIVVSLLSDTVAISITTDEENPIVQGATVAFASSCIIEVLSLFLDTEPHLVMRGCIGYGKHIASGSFIAGPAVDEAAEHMGIAEGAFVWLLPSAQRVYELNLNEYYSHCKAEYGKGKTLFEGIAALDEFEEHFHLLRPWCSVIRDYPMPIKGGGTLNVFMLNPYVRLTVDDQEHIQDRTLTVMADDRLDVWLKRQNTMTFLKIAEQQFFQLVRLFAPYLDENANIYQEIKDPKSAQHSTP